MEILPNEIDDVKDKNEYLEIFNCEIRKSYSIRTVHLVYHIPFLEITEKEIIAQLRSSALKKSNKIIKIYVSPEIGEKSKQEHFHVLATYENTLNIRSAIIFMVKTNTNQKIVPFLSTSKNKHYFKRAEDYVQKGGSYTYEGPTAVENILKSSIVKKATKLTQKERVEIMISEGLEMYQQGYNDKEIALYWKTKDPTLAFQNMNNWLNSLKTYRQKNTLIIE